MNPSLFKRIFILTLAVVAAAAAACENLPDFNVDIDSKAPESFVFDGQSTISDFEIWDVPRTKPLNKINPFTANGKTIWKIAPTDKRAGNAWPKITYGMVPEGFSQSVPANGSPPKLIETKLYAACISNGDRNSVLYFEIRNGRTVNVTHEIFGQ